jgi:acyl-CoA thioesterase FadM
VDQQAYVRWIHDIATADSHDQVWSVALHLDTRTARVIRSHFIGRIRPAFANDELLVGGLGGGMDTQAPPRRYRFVRVRDFKTLVKVETVWLYCDAAAARSLDIPDEVRLAFPIVSDEGEVVAAIEATRAVAQ